MLCGAALLIPRPVPATPQQSDSITLTVAAPDSVRRGEAVPIALRLTNSGDRPLNLYLTGRSITFDIIVARPDGGVVWRRLERVASQQILQVKTLTPGETLELTDRWRQRTNAGAPAPAGDYTVTGIIPTDGRPLRSAPARLRVTP